MVGISKRGRETTIITTLNKLENISGMIGWQNTGNLVSVCKGIIGLVQRRRLRFCFQCLDFLHSSDESYSSVGGLMGGPGGGGGGYATTGSIGATAGSGGDAVDECGLRFLLAMRHHTCLMRSLPAKHRAVLEEKVIKKTVSR